MRFSIRLFFIILARRIFKDRFEKDKDFRYGYQANIAMLLHDKYGIVDCEKRNEAANDIMKIIFDAEVPLEKKIINCKGLVNDRFEILDL